MYTYYWHLHGKIQHWMVPFNSHAKKSNGDCRPKYPLHDWNILNKNTYIYIIIYYYYYHSYYYSYTYIYIYIHTYICIFKPCRIHQPEHNPCRKEKKHTFQVIIPHPNRQKTRGSLVEARGSWQEKGFLWTMQLCSGMYQDLTKQDIPSPMGSGSLDLSHWASELWDVPESKSIRMASPNSVVTHASS